MGREIGPHRKLGICFSRRGSAPSTPICSNNDYGGTVNGAWKTESQMWREFLRSVDKPLGEGASKPYVSFCPEGTIKGIEALDSIKGSGPRERNRR